jgi:Zn-dependent M28 family amino/carboxypeptidase
MVRYFLLLVCLLPLSVNGQSVSVDKLKKHIYYLADDKLQGRGTGEEGARLAAKYIAKQFKKIGLKKGVGDSYFQSYTYKKSVNPHATDEQKDGKPIEGQNVIGYLDNGAENTIIIGAHYDHLGLGHDGNSLDANPEGKIHNGADDNASGTAGVIELARYFVENKRTEPYNFLFICFSGEELGLIGSKKYCETPTIDLKKVDYMINMDMIGRLNTEKKLIISGVGTSGLWVNLIDYVKTNLSIKTDSSGVGPSDYTSFYRKNVPVLAFFTGQHADYHKPSDDADKINYEGEKLVLEYIAQIVEATCTFPKLVFEATKEPTMGSKGFKVTMGVMPDYAFDGNGLRIDGVTDNRPAAKAGLKTGDIVTKLGKNEITNVYTYMDALNTFKKGETTQVTFKRGSETLVLDITF